MYIDPTDPAIREAIREIHFFLNGYIKGVQDAATHQEKLSFHRWEGLDPTHLDALDCVLKYLDEKADQNGKEIQDDKRTGEASADN